MKKEHPISKRSLPRLTQYLTYLKGCDSGLEYISATTIATALGLNQVQVRKDLAAVSSGGKPKVGYRVKTLTQELGQFLGYQSGHSAILVGAGRLGKALMGYQGFDQYGLAIVAAFDTDDEVCGRQENGIPILSIDQMSTVCSKHQVEIGIITVPSAQAQRVCDQMVEHGITAIWNFATTHLVVPAGILVQNENMAGSLSVLSNYLTQTIPVPSTRQTELEGE